MRFLAWFRRWRTVVAGAGVLLVSPVTLAGAAPLGLMGTNVPGPLRDVVDPPNPEYGATGTLPGDLELSLDLVGGDPAEPAEGTGGQADLPPGRPGIPGMVLGAYVRSEDVLAGEQPGCRVRWWLLAGIGKVESNHAWGGYVDDRGTTLRPILGPVLNGAGGFAAIGDTDGGRWDGDPVWDRAVGPMQFIPSTWRAWGGNGNPNNVYDAAVAAGRYLCAGGRNLSDPAQRAAAVFSYNHSNSYVRLVLSWAYAYRSGVTQLPSTTVPLPVGNLGEPGSPPSSTGSGPSGTKTPAPSGAGNTGPSRTPAREGGGSTPTSRPTSSPTTDPTPTPTPTPTPSPTTDPTPTPTPTPTPSPSADPTPSPTPSPTTTDPNASG